MGKITGNKTGAPGLNEYRISRIRSGTASADQQMVATLSVDDEGVIRWADANAEQMFGYRVLQMQGLPLQKIIASREENPMAHPINDKLAQGGTCRLTFRHASGYFFTGCTERPAAGEKPDTPQAYILSRGDMPLDGRILRAAEGCAGLGIWELDAENNRMFWSDGLFHLMDLEPEHKIQPDHALYFFQENQGRVKEALRNCIGSGDSFSMELPVLTAKQNRRWLRIGGHSIRDGDRVHSVTGTAVDITDLRQQKRTADEWKHFTQSLLAASEDLMLILDTELQVVALNRAFSEQFHHAFQVTPDVGDYLPGLLDAYPHEKRLYQRLWERAMERDAFCVEMPLAQENDKLPVYEIHFHRIFTPEGELLGAAHVGRSMSSRHAVTDNLNYLNTHDPMTGLLNRRELIQRLKRAINISQTSGTPQALAYLDLDNFEALNAQAGPSACDRYLRELGALLMSRLRQRDAIARVAGDKFALVLDNCGAEEARTVCDNIRQAVDEFTFEWHDEKLHTTLSGGLLPLNPGQDYQADNCLALAADLCQSAKTAGRDRLHVHRDEKTAESETNARDLLTQLETAIRTDAIELRFQTIRPITSPTWGDHVEVLTRLALPDPENPEAISYWEPADFLPIAERFDLASELDRRIIRKTLTWLNNQPLLQPRLKLLSFNLSLASVENPGFIDELREMLTASAFDAGRFCFEIRETDAVRHPESVDRCFRALQHLGCKVALDNAGSSGQSYALISRMPVDFIKLDQRLMQNITTDPVQHVMVDAIHKVAEVSGKQTIAPFIEDEATLRAVRQIGIHFGQGYWLAAPKSLEELAPPSLEEAGVLHSRSNPLNSD